MTEAPSVSAITPVDKLWAEIEQCAGRFEHFMRSAESEAKRHKFDAEESLRNKANEQAVMIIARVRRVRAALLSSDRAVKEPDHEEVKDDDGLTRVHPMDQVTHSPTASGNEVE